MKSSFQLLSYKIDNVHLHSSGKMENILEHSFKEESWEIAIALRSPLAFENKDIYISGMDVKIYLGEEKNPDILLECGILGVFQFYGESIETPMKEKIVKHQFPAILSPYLRAFVTGTLSLAGYEPVIFPLFNFNALAEDQLRDKPIAVVSASGIKGHEKIRRVCYTGD